MDKPYVHMANYYHVGKTEADQNRHQPFCPEEIREVGSSNANESRELTQAAFTPSITLSTILALNERVPTATPVTTAAAKIGLSRKLGSKPRTHLVRSAP